MACRRRFARVHSRSVCRTTAVSCTSFCLLPDRYGYDYGTMKIEPSADAAPIFACRTSGAVPLPEAAPRIVWRAGLDINPLDIADPSAAAWLETLVWPEQESRLARLRAAMAIAAEDPPRVTRGLGWSERGATLARRSAVSLAGGRRALSVPCLVLRRRGPHPG